MRLTTAVFTSIALVLGVATTASLALPNPLASILSPGAQTVPASIVSCGSPEDILSIDYIKISPESPARGKNLTIEAHGVLSEEIKEGAYMKIVVK
ncbi:hypothetical protein BG004_004053 [Podila humilis]|nr:hypothetical protein BG004_004053 [Podila humilis]